LRITHTTPPKLMLRRAAITIPVFLKRHEEHRHWVPGRAAQGQHTNPYPRESRSRSEELDVVRRSIGEGR
jgi:hypothetical protein